MKKRTVWFGVPMIVVRMIIRTLLLPLSVMLVYYFVFVVLMQLDIIPLDWLFNPAGVMVLIGGPGLLVSVCIWIYGIRVSRFMKRLQMADGRMCFGCGYEIGDGLERCSECGGEWSLDDLNRGWRKRVLGEKG
tara:strand:+ start:13609 stop:14007 length:399 start_codon:yes stop_codon:yes gene_type:complete